MKIKLLIIAGLSAVLALSGCATKTIDASSTKLSISSPTGKTLEVVFPKELDAKKLNLEVNPDTGVITLKADSLKSSSQGIIESASSAQADALGKMADTLTALAPLLVPAR